MMKTDHIIILLFCLSLTLFGCATQIKPYTEKSEITAETEGECRLWKSAQDMDQAFKKSGQIYDDEKLRYYLQGIMDKLYPEYNGHIRVNILKAPVLNAFAMPNGSIYVNTGLLAAMENEAQLASVLAHEGIHFLQKHAALQRENYHRSVGAAIAISLLGVPFIGDLAAMSSIFGYSREHEWEADTLGHQRLIKAGYDIREAPKAFEHLAMEAKANKAKEPFFFASHPKLQERIKKFEELNQAITLENGRIGTKTYQKHVAELRLTVLQEKITVGKYESVIAVLTEPKLKKIYTGHSIFYLGEAYRLRNHENDLKSAVKAYNDVKNTHPGYAPTYKSLGIIHMKNKDFKKAKQCFKEYLKRVPKGTDAAFVKQYIQQIDRQKDAL